MGTIIVVAYFERQFSFIDIVLQFFSVLHFMLFVSKHPSKVSGLVHICLKPTFQAICKFRRDKANYRDTVVSFQVVSVIHSHPPQ